MPESLQVVAPRLFWNKILNTFKPISKSPFMINTGFSDSHTECCSFWDQSDRRYVRWGVDESRRHGRDRGGVSLQSPSLTSLLSVTLSCPILLLQQIKLFFFFLSFLFGYAEVNSEPHYSSLFQARVNAHIHLWNRKKPMVTYIFVYYLILRLFELIERLCGGELTLMHTITKPWLDFY